MWNQPCDQDTNLDLKVKQNLELCKNSNKSHSTAKNSENELLQSHTHTSTQQTYLQSQVLALLLGDQSEDGAAVFAGSNQDLNPRLAGWQRGC